MPYEIPDSWQWVRLGNVANLYTGNSINASQKRSLFTNVDGIHYIATKDVGFDSHIDYDNGIQIPDQYLATFKIASSNSVLLCLEGGSAGRKIGYLKRDVCFGNKLCNLSFYAGNNKFMYYFLQNPQFFQDFQSKKTGIIGGVSRNNLGLIFLPLPPLAEQKRIVEQVEKLLAQVEEYAKHYHRLKELNKKFPDQLKKSVLQYAMQGKLVPQDESDDSVEHLLENIRAEKDRLFAQGKLKKKDLQSSIIFQNPDDKRHYEKVGKTVMPIEVPYDIPETWRWVRLKDISSYIQRGRSPKYSDIRKYPVVAQKCIQWTGFSIDLAKFISPDTLDKYSPERILQENDLLWNSTGLGSLGRIAYYQSKKNQYGWAVADSHVTVIRTMVYYKYLYYFIASPIVQDIIEQQASGSTKQKELSLQLAMSYLIPLPPLKEQERIVATIEKYFALLT